MKTSILSNRKKIIKPIRKCMTLRYLRLYTDYPNSYSDIAVPTRTLSHTQIMESGNVKDGVVSYQFYDCILNVLGPNTVIRGQPTNFSKLKHI